MTPGEPLQQQTERVLIQFLDREVALTETLIELTRLEGRQGKGPKTAQGMQHVNQGLDTIRKFIGRISSTTDYARIAHGLEQLETKAAGLAAGLKRKPEPDSKVV